MFDAGVVEFGAGVRQVGKLLLGTIVDGCVAKRSVLGFGWNSVAPFKEEVFDIMFDGQATGAVRVVSGEFDAGKIGAGPVLGEFIVLEEDVARVVGVAFANIFDAEVINDESEEDWAPLVAP